MTVKANEEMLRKVVWEQDQEMYKESSQRLEAVFVFVFAWKLVLSDYHLTSPGYGPHCASLECVLPNIRIWPHW